MGKASLVLPDLTYAFVTGFNKYIQYRPSHDPFDGDIPAGGNIGIIRDPFNLFPDLPGRKGLVAATRPIPFSNPDNLVLAAGGSRLYAGYRGVKVTENTSGALFGFSVDKMLATVRSARQSDLDRYPIDDIDETIDVRAEYVYLGGNLPAGEFIYGVPPGSEHPPIATGGSPQGFVVFYRLIDPGYSSW